MSNLNLKDAWLSLAPDANEPQIEAMLMRPAVLPFLGFELNEIESQYLVGNGGAKVDLAARKNHGDDIFCHTKANPSLLIELKKRQLDLSFGSNDYKKTVSQLKGYLHPKSKNCHSARWGIITNAEYIQLFRRHGKVVYPYTKNIKLTADNIEEKVKLIKHYIDNQKRSLFVAIYNNKGGVGKTTTVINLAGILSLPQGKLDNPLGFDKKVLVVDFDPNQKDLTDLLNVQLGKLKLSEYLKDHKNHDIQDVISRYTLKTKSGKEYGFDVIPVDEELHQEQTQYTKYLTKSFLRRSLNPLKNDYDYVLIDSPPGTNRFTEEAIAAADVILMPSKHNGIASFKNAAIAMKIIFPMLGESRRQFDVDAEKFGIVSELSDPVPLPIFFNGEAITPTQKKQAQEAITGIIKQAKKEEQIDLMRFFFPKYRPSHKNLEIFEMPSYAHIASAAFSNRPAVFTSKKAREYYRDLVREYFI